MNEFENYDCRIRIQRHGTQTRMLILSASGLRVRNPEAPWSDNLDDATAQLDADLRASIPGTLYAKD